MNTIKNQEEAQKLFNDSMEGAWKQYKEEFIDDLPGINDPMKSFLQVVFNQGFQRGLAMLSTYMMSIMLQSQLDAIVGKLEQTDDDKPPQPTSQYTLDELFKKLMTDADLDTN